MQFATLFVVLASVCSASNLRRPAACPAGQKQDCQDNILEIGSNWSQTCADLCETYCDYNYTLCGGASVLECVTTFHASQCEILTSSTTETSGPVIQPPAPSRAAKAVQIDFSEFVLNVEIAPKHVAEISDEKLARADLADEQPLSEEKPSKEEPLNKAFWKLF